MPKARAIYQVGERVEIYTGEKTLTRLLKVSSGAKNGRVRVTILFQACDPSICRPPEELTVSAELTRG